MDQLSALLLSTTASPSSVQKTPEGTFFGTLQLDTLVKDKCLCINKEMWTQLKAEYTQGFLVQALTCAIQEYQLPLPWLPTSLENMKADFTVLRQFDVNELLEKVEDVTVLNFRRSPSPQKHALSPFLLKKSRVGCTASNYFHFLHRMQSCYATSESPYRRWTTSHLCTKLLEGLFRQNMEQVTREELKRLLQRDIAGQFMPCYMKFFIEKFKATRVLDFCSGWGDRLCGFFASNATHYVGIDPNTALHATYAEQIEHYGRLNVTGAPKNVTMHCDRAEVLDVLALYGENAFDLVFTSPPYFNRERYCREETQSVACFKTYQQWLEGFLCVAIGRAWSVLSAGGYMCINIADLYMKKGKYLPICENMNDFIAQLPQARYIGTIFLQNATTKKNEKWSCEPVWIWQKASFEN